MENLNKTRNVQNYFPFLSGSEKHSNKKIEAVGPGSYKLTEQRSNIFKSSAAFGSSQPKSKSIDISRDPGPGTYNISHKWLKPLNNKFIRQKLIHNTVPSFPLTSVGYDKNNVIPVLPTSNPKSSPPKQGISFPKAPKSPQTSESTSIGPGSYNLSIPPKITKGLTFSKSSKNLSQVFPLCQVSYYNEKHHSSISVKEVPAIFQNFGSRCERFAPDQNTTIGPGYYRNDYSKGQCASIAPFNSSDTRFK